MVICYIDRLQQSEMICFLEVDAEINWYLLVFDRNKLIGNKKQIKNNCKILCIKNWWKWMEISKRSALRLTFLFLSIEWKEKILLLYSYLTILELNIWIFSEKIFQMFTSEYNMWILLEISPHISVLPMSSIGFQCLVSFNGG